MRDKFNLACEKCKSRNYTVSRNKKVSTTKIHLNKFCNKCRVHTLHKEAK